MGFSKFYVPNYSMSSQIRRMSWNPLKTVNQSYSGGSGSFSWMRATFVICFRCDPNHYLWHCLSIIVSYLAWILERIGNIVTGTKAQRKQSQVFTHKQLFQWFLIGFVTVGPSHVLRDWWPLRLERKSSTYESRNIVLNCFFM